jgi:hypothetical protein
VDKNWYGDLGDTYHITNELDKHAIWDKYNGAERVHTTSGAGMEISHTGNSFIHTPTRKLELCNVLHIPNATKNLMFVHRFALDNNVFFKIHPWFFLIKDQDTRATLLCHDGLYPIPTSYPVKFIFGVNKPSIIRWHGRLGYPSFQIVQRILRDLSLPFEQESNKDYVCGPCQQANSH